MTHRQPLHSVCGRKTCHLSFSPKQEAKRPKDVQFGLERKPEAIVTNPEAKLSGTKYKPMIANPKPEKRGNLNLFKQLMRKCTVRHFVFCDNILWRKVIFKTLLYNILVRTVPFTQHCVKLLRKKIYYRWDTDVIIYLCSN